MDEAALDATIAKRVREMLQEADLSVITAKKIRRELEQELGLKLRSKKAFLHEQIASYMEGLEDSGEAEDVAASDGEDIHKQRLRSKINTAIKESVPRETSDKKKENKVSTAGFRRICQMSDALEAVVGVPQASRPQAVKLLWVYIRKHALQVPEDKRQIKCDEALKKVFKTNVIDMFEMNKALTKHVIPLDELAYEDGLVRAENKKMQRQEEERKRAVEPQPEPGTKAAKRLARKRKAEKNRERNKENKISKIEKKNSEKSGRGFQAPVRISRELKEFLDTEKWELPRPEVTKQMWEYIKNNQLQDPSDKRRILCDEKLEKLFHCKSFSGFGGMPKLLGPHYKTY